MFLLVPHLLGFREGRAFLIYSQTRCEERMLFHYECYLLTQMDDQTSLLLFFPSFEGWMKVKNGGGDPECEEGS